MQKDPPNPMNETPMTATELEDIFEKHTKFITGRIGGARADMQYRNLSGVDFSGKDFSQTDFTGSILDNADMRDGIFVSAVFFGCDMRGTKMEKGDFRRADFRGAFLMGADMTGADLKDADFREGKIMRRDKNGIMQNRPNTFSRDGEHVRTVLAGAKLKDADLSGSHAKNADFSNSDLTGVKLNAAYYNNVDFTDANIANANLTGSDLSDAIFIGAIMENTNLEGSLTNNIIMSDPENTDGSEEKSGPQVLEKSIEHMLEEHVHWIDSAGNRGVPLNVTGYDLRDIRNLQRFSFTAMRLKESIFIGKNLSQCQMQSAVFNGSDFRDCVFLGSDLRGSSFANCTMDRADLSNARLCPLKFKKPDGTESLKRTDLSGVSLKYSVIENADFRDCIMMGIDLSHAVFKNCDFRRADMTGAILTDTVFENPKLEDALVDQDSAEAAS